MGNRPISVGIRTNQSSYNAGDTIYGRVYLSVSKESVCAEELRLRLVGEEQVTVHHQTSHDVEHEEHGQNRHETRRTEDHYERSKSCFFDLVYPLHTCEGGQLTRGQYEYPFSINLPENLTSSMNVRKGESYCGINYRVVVLVVQEGSSLFRSNIQANQNIDISSVGSPLDDTSIQLPVEVFPITNCCCFEKGTMVLEASVDKTIVAPRSTVNVAYRAINNSTLDVNSINVKISQITTWCSNGHSEALETILDERNVDGTDYPALRKLATKPRRYFGAAEAEALILNKEWDTTQLHLPSDSLDSYHGRLLEVKHVLSVQLISNGCCTLDPDSSTSIHIVRLLQSDEANDASAINLGVTPSAPLDTLDTASPNFDDQKHPPVSSMPVAEAHALPPDWHAQLAEVVEIPMAQAVIVEPSSPIETKELT